MSAQPNIYCAILAGGSGTRMNSPVPKQFLMLGDAPVFIHCLRTFLKESRIRQVWIGSNGDWYDLALEQIRQYIGGDERVRMCPGGADREGTMLNVLSAIRENNRTTEDDVVLIHDSVRPFVTGRIIADVIAAMEHCDACNTVVPVNDTVVRSADGQTVSDMPLRSELFAGQSPQGFRIHKLLDAYERLSPEERARLTETTKICYFSDIPIHLVRGEFFNFKITTPYDLEAANFALDYIKRTQE